MPYEAKQRSRHGVELGKIYLQLMEVVFKQNVDQVLHVNEHSGDLVISYSDVNHQCIIIRGDHSL